MVCASFNPSFTACFFFLYKTVSSIATPASPSDWLNLCLLLGQPLHMLMWHNFTACSINLLRTEQKQKIMQTKFSEESWEDKDPSWQSPHLFKHSQTDKINDSKEVLTSNLLHNRLQKIKPHLKTKEGGVIIPEQTTNCNWIFFIVLLRF